LPQSGAGCELFRRPGVFKGSRAGARLSGALR
jgi:hypothetical protein